MEMIKQSDFKQVEERFTSLTNNENFIREASFALQLVNKNNQLLKCDKPSVIQALLNVANVGLTLNPVAKLAYLVPRWNTVTRKTECYLEPSYQGLVKLITDAGGISSVYCYLVYRGDEFEETLGSRPEIVHKPKRETEIITHVYAVAVFADGRQQFEIMSTKEVHEIRETSSSYQAFKANKIKSCVWIDHEGEMFRKTVIRRLCKYLPKTDKWERINEAINLDETDYAITMQQEAQIETLLINANITNEESQQIFRELNGMSRTKADRVITRLRYNQIEAVTHGEINSMSQIHEQLNKIEQDESK